MKGQFNYYRVKMFSTPCYCINEYTTEIGFVYDEKYAKFICDTLNERENQHKKEVHATGSQV